MKKLMSLYLISVLLLSSIAPAVFAAEGEITDRQTEAIALLTDLDIFPEIPNGGGGEVSRAEFAKIAVRVMGGTDTLTDTPKRIYTDVLPDHDAAASVQYLYDRGIMVGYENASFQPDGNITLEEAAKVMVSILGYSERAKQKGYPNGYYFIALANKLLKGVTAARNESATYADLAVIVQNVLETDQYLMVNEYLNGYAVEEEAKDEAYMEYVLDIYKLTGRVEAYGATSLAGAGDTYKEHMCKIGSELIDRGDIDLSPYLGMQVHAYYRVDDGGSHLLHVAAAHNSSVVEVKADDIQPETTKRVFQYETENGLEKIDIADNAIVIYNGKRMDVVADADLIPENGVVRLVETGGVYDVVVIKEYETYLVDKAVATDQILTFKYDRASLDLGSPDVQATYYLEGEQVDFSSISASSVVSIALSKNKLGDKLAEVLISNNRVESKAVNIETREDKRLITLEDGAVYELTAEYMKRIAENQQGSYAPTLNSAGTFYIDAFGKLAAYVLLTTGKNYAYVVKCGEKVYGDSSTYIRLFNKEGAFETIEIDDKVKLNGSRVDKKEIMDALKQTGENNTIHQLVLYKTNKDGRISELTTAIDKMNEPYYVGAEDEFVLNATARNNNGVQSGLRFYKNMAENLPFTYVDGKTIQFLIPTDKNQEKEYRVATKTTAIDTSYPGPVYIYDAGVGGTIGAIITNTASTGKYSNASIIDKVVTIADEEGDVYTGLQFVGGTTLMVDDATLDKEQRLPSNTKWCKQMDYYTTVTIRDLKRGDVIEYSTANNKLDNWRLIVRPDDVGPVRSDVDRMQENGNIIADVLSVAENGRTAVIYYCDYYGNYRYQAMLVNGTVYRYESSEDKIYNSSTSDLRAGDKILLNSYYWSPKVVVIFR